MKLNWELHETRGVAKGYSTKPGTRNLLSICVANASGTSCTASYYSGGKVIRIDTPFKHIDDAKQAVETALEPETLV